MLALFVAAFLSFGTLLVLVGASQAELARDLVLDLEHTGLLGASLALGAGGGIVAAGPLFDGPRRRWVFSSSAALVGAALLSASADMGFNGAILRIAAAGVGAGAYNTVVNARVAERYGPAASRPMALVHGAATIGAIVGAPLAGWVALEHHWTSSFHAVGAAHVLVALWGLSAGHWRDAAPIEQPEPPKSTIPALPQLLPFVVIAFAYVSVEAALTNFAVPYATVGLGLDADRGRLSISALWLGILGSRMLLYTWRSLGARTIVRAGLLGGAVLLAGVWLRLATPELLLGLVGLLMGLTYPLLMTLLGQRFRERRGTIAGLVGGGGAAGGFAGPWLSGVAADAFGVAWALSGVAACGLLIAGAALALGHDRESP